jgi:hypothetical protein
MQGPRPRAARALIASRLTRLNWDQAHPQKVASATALHLHTSSTAARADRAVGNLSEVIVPNQLRTTLVACFEDRLEAERAVDELEQAGFSADQVGFVLRGSDVAAGGMLTDAQGAKDGKGALTGMATGAGLGAILGAAAGVLVPGVGPVIAGGVLTMAFGGAIAGTAIGGIFGAIAGLGVSEEEARFYEKEFQSGKAIVAVKAGNRAADAAEILRRHGGYDLQNRRISDVPTQGIFSEP